MNRDMDLKDKLADQILGKPHWSFRVIETTRAGKPFMAIHKVDFDGRGMPVRYDASPAGIGGDDGDAMVKLLNEIAMALTKPSLAPSDFPLQPLPGLDGLQRRSIRLLDGSEDIQ